MHGAYMGVSIQNRPVEQELVVIGFSENLIADVIMFHHERFAMFFLRGVQGTCNMDAIKYFLIRSN